MVPDFPAGPVAERRGRGQPEVKRWGPLAANQLEWRDNSDVLLGTGSTLAIATLPTGINRIWLVAYDSAGQMAKVPVEIEIEIVP